MTGINVLVVAAHPDDEVLGCGGCIAKHTASGDSVNILILAEGATSRDEERNVQIRIEQVSALRQAACEAADILGALPPRFCGLPDNRLDSLILLDITKRVEAVVKEVQPSIVYTHHGGDLNIDHRIVYQAVMTACRPVPHSTVKAIYSFETLSSTEWSSPTIGPTFLPTRFVDIKEFLGQKLNALEAYSEEMMDFPHARSIEAIKALARLRGASAGMEAAEVL